MNTYNIDGTPLCNKGLPPIGSEFRVGDYLCNILDYIEDTAVLLCSDFVEYMRFDDQKASYLESDVRQYLNTAVYDEVARLVGAENIVEHYVDLTSDDCSTVDGVTERVSLITKDQYRRYRTKIPLSGWWWTATSRGDPDDNCTVCCVRADGEISEFDCDRSNGGVRPLITVKAAILLAK